MVSRIKETESFTRWVPTTYKTRKKWVQETVRSVDEVGHREVIEGVPSIIFEGDDVGFLLHTIYQGGHANLGKLFERLSASLGHERIRQLIANYRVDNGLPLGCVSSYVDK